MFHESHFFGDGPCVFVEVVQASKMLKFSFSNLEKKLLKEDASASFKQFNVIEFL